MEPANTCFLQTLKMLLTRLRAVLSWPGRVCHVNFTFLQFLGDASLCSSKEFIDRYARSRTKQPLSYDENDHSFVHPGLSIRKADQAWTRHEQSGRSSQVSILPLRCRRRLCCDTVTAGLKRTLLLSVAHRSLLIINIELSVPDRQKELCVTECMFPHARTRVGAE